MVLPCSLSVCFFCPFGILITLLGEEGAGLCACRAFVLAVRALVCIAFSLSPDVRGWVRLLLVALHGLFCLPFFQRDFFETCNKWVK